MRVMYYSVCMLMLQLLPSLVNKDVYNAESGDQTSRFLTRLYIFLPHSHCFVCVYLQQDS